MREKIKAEKIILRKYESNFAPLLFEAAIESRGGEFTRWMPWCHKDYSFADSRIFIEKVSDEWEIETTFAFAIFDARTEEFLGGIGLNQPNLTHKFYNLGYWIRVSKQNRGIASRATRLLAKAAFEDLNINRLEILTAIENSASQKAAEKSDAKREGILRRRIVIGDKIHDAVMFSFVREDFADQIL